MSSCSRTVTASPQDLISGCCQYLLADLFVFDPAVQHEVILIYFESNVGGTVSHPLEHNNALGNDLSSQQAVPGSQVTVAEMTCMGFRLHLLRPGEHRCCPGVQKLQVGAMQGVYRAKGNNMCHSGDKTGA